VLETAHRMGYFDHPKGADAGDVADELGISRSTLAEHLSTAQSKLFDAILDARAGCGERGRYRWRGGERRRGRSVTRRGWRRRRSR
jgi:hypothetical protein